jgi:oleandomycin transport system ATP-binding protein
MIRTEGLVKRYGKVVALNGLDLLVPRGSVLGLLGPNGAGKTTAVRILTTLLEPDEGFAQVAGMDVCAEPHKVREQIGLSGQNAAVDEHLTGYENLHMVGRLYHIGKAESQKRARELLEQFDLVEAGDRPAKTYSGGMRRRLDLAASLVGRPQLLYLDEPTTGLDPRSRLELWSLVRRLVASGVTVLLTTQYLEEADELADDIVVIDHGRVIATGTPDELKARTGAQHLAVRPVDPADVPTVMSVVHDLVGAAPDLEGPRVTAPVTDPALLPAAVRRLEDAGVVIAELTLRNSSLNEVFLSLTGHRADDDATDSDTREGALA